MKKKKTNRSSPASNGPNAAKSNKNSRAKAPRVAVPSVIVYCRAGFESDAAEELSLLAAERGIDGKPVHVNGTAFALFVPTEARDLERLRSFVRLENLIFARQLIWSSGIVASLPDDDRVTPIIEQVMEHLAPATENSKFARLIVEPADSDDGKELSRFCTSLSRPLENALRKHALIPKSTPKVAWDPTLHVFMLDAGCVYIGISDPENASPWPMGIPRLRFPAGAPSRAALKLEEAFKTFLTPEEEAKLMPEGSTAIDLGAAPGGWTALLVQKGVYVTAVDNASLDPALLRSDQVEHIREDAFKFRPEESVHWLFCDVVDSPSRVAALMANWLDRRLAKHAIFNLKLPMKKRLEEIKMCLAHLERVNLGKGKRLRLQVKQLYHDRSEVTVCATNPGLKK